MTRQSWCLVVLAVMAGAGIKFTDGSEIHLDTGGVLRTTEKPRKVLAQMAAALLATDGTVEVLKDGDR